MNAPGIVTDRPSADDYFLMMAFVAALRGTCGRRQVGAVIVRNGRVVSTGYNGAPSGMRHCDHRMVPNPMRDRPDDPAEVMGDMENGHCAIAVHAELNAIIDAARTGKSTEGTVLYCTDLPCAKCIIHVIQAGVREVYYARAYRPNPRVVEACSAAGVKLERRAPDWAIMTTKLAMMTAMQ